MSGLTAEKMFDYLLSLAGYENVSDYTTDQLITIADRVRPGRIQNVETKRKENGKTTRWNVISPRLVIDWVFGIDSIIAPSGVSNATRFGFDVTLNPDEVDKKMKKLKSFAPLWKAIGIDKVGVILIVPPEEFGIALLNGKQKEQIVESLLDNVIYALDEQQIEVRSYVLAF